MRLSSPTRPELRTGGAASRSASICTAVLCLDGGRFARWTDSRMKLPRPMRGALAAALVLLIAATGACHHRANAPPRPKPPFAPFNFQIVGAANHYSIEGFIAHADAPGRLPALLVLTAGEGNARRCIEQSAGLRALGIVAACVSIPGYGKSSGPSRFVGPQAVAAAHRAVDLMAARPDVDRERIAVWGLSDGAVAAGLLMDSDPRLRAVILQSGFYDTLKMWPEASLREKVAILRQVWPSRLVHSG